MPNITQLASKIDKVKVYAAGATVSRIADLHLENGETPEQVEISGLPLALDDSSVRVQVEGNASPVIPTDIRISLAVPSPPETPNSPAEEQLRQAKAEVRLLQETIALIDNEISVLKQLHVPNQPEAEPGKAPPPSPLAARLAIANFQDEQIRSRIQEQREIQNSLQEAKTHLDELLHKQELASTAQQVKPHELRKTVIISLSYPPEVTVSQQQLIVEYFVPGARWTPTYLCRLDSSTNTSAITVRAFLCQRTGEDWSGVRLELSTANPMTWCELPELPSLRLGRTQPVPRKSGWRLPPVGATTLFADYDRQKQQVVTRPRAFTQPASRINSSFYNLELNLINQYRDQKLTQEKAQDDLDTELECLLSDTDKAIEFHDLFDESGDEFADLDAMLSKALEKTECDLELYSLLEDAESSLRHSSPAQYLRGRDYKPKETEFELGKTLNKASSTSGMNLVNLSYNLMRLPGADDPNKRGKLLLQNQQEVYLELFKQQQFVVTFNVLEIVDQAISKSRQCLSTPLPPGGISVRDTAGSFDYAYSADGRVDVPSDGQFHSVALTSQSTDVNLRYVVVPREDTNVFRIAQLRNPLDAPLLSGSADVYVDGEYILSTTLPTVPAKGQVELGLGVEQGIKVARNTTYQEKRSSQLLVAFNELNHHIKIDIANRLANEARIEIRERIPVPQEGEKVDVELGKVSPQWHKYEQEEREQLIRGGYCWRIKVPSQQQVKLSAQYTIKTYADSEVIGGNRRE
ncbi:MAG: mucoidy inhibitor MuiA family protein [Coleofasciculus sp. C1-SOL-03]|uniref:mucoidy inhibitor MuiA family protein n=1 Tax=Coleofasciculus sp. C1-SOL-03 TaxID=3069522 RepID=UPI0032F1C62A